MSLWCGFGACWARRWPPRTAVSLRRNENDGSWHTLDPDEVLRHLGSSATTGLSVEQVRERVAQHGRSILPTIEVRGGLEILLDQGPRPAGGQRRRSVLSLATGGVLDAAAILSRDRG